MSIPGLDLSQHSWCQAFTEQFTFLSCKKKMKKKKITLLDVLELHHLYTQFPGNICMEKAVTMEQTGKKVHKYNKQMIK